MIYGLTGKARHGKSTAVGMLKEIDNSVIQINFKDALIKELRQNFPELLQEIVVAYDGQFSIDELFINKPPLMRALMQNYGTDVRRKDNPNYWVEQWAKDVDKQTKDVVTDDVRFQNEADAIKLRGGIVAKIIKEGAEEVNSSHASETEMDSIEVDYVVSVPAGQHDVLRKEIESIHKMNHG